MLAFEDLVIDLAAHTVVRAGSGAKLVSAIGSGAYYEPARLTARRANSVARTLAPNLRDSHPAHQRPIPSCDV